MGSWRDLYIQQSIMESAEVNKVDSRIAKVRKVHLMHGYQIGIGWNLEPYHGRRGEALMVACF